MNREKLLERLVLMLAANNMSENEASIAAGLNQSFVNNIKSGKSKNPAKRNMIRLASVFRCDVEWLLGNTDTFRAQTNHLVAGTDYAGGRRCQMFSAREIKQKGDGFFELARAAHLDHAVNWFVSKKPEVYGIDVPDDSMAPRYQICEILLVDPSAPAPTRGYGLVVLNDGRVSIRWILRNGPTHLKLGTLNGDDPVEIELSEVRSVQRIMMSGDVL